MIRKTCGSWTLETTSNGFMISYRHNAAVTSDVTAFGVPVEDLTDLRYLCERALVDLAK